MRAIVLQGATAAALVEDHPEPKLRPDYVLVETKAVALNPTDWKHIDKMNTPGCVVGCDYAGVVLDVGPESVKQFNKGDRVCGFTHGSNRVQPEDGAFAEKLVARAGVQMKIPDHMSFEVAATMGVAVVTCGQGLYQQMQLNWPNNPTNTKETILIYGGSSAMGTMGIRLASLSGYRVITTCSPRNFDLVKSYGAEAAFDYKDAEAVEQITKYTNNNLKLIWDTIALSSSAEFCSKVIVSGGTYGAILTVKLPRDDVKETYSLGYTGAGKPFSMGGKEYSAEETNRDYEFMQKFIVVAEQLLAEDKIKPHPVKVEKGLEKVLDGVDLLRNDKVSGQKLVYVL